MNNPLVSVIMPAYNAEAFIEDSINSVLNQTYSNFELLITNDQSTDRTLEIIESYNDERIEVLSNDENRGYLLTFNDLLKRCNGEFITSIDADDYYHLEKLEKQIKAFGEDPTISFCGTNFNRVSANGKIIETSNSPNAYNEILTHLRDNADIEMSITALMIKEEVFKKIGGYREFYIGCAAEDYDWFRRIAENFKGIFLQDALFNYRFHATSLTRKINLDLKQRFIIEITHFFSKQREIKGTDDIETGDFSEFNSFMKKINEPYKKDSSLLDRQVAFDLAISGSFVESFNYIKSAINKKPFQFYNYLTLFFILVIKVFPIEFLYQIKSRVKFNHIAKKL